MAWVHKEQFRSIVWSFIILFSLFSTPHVELVLSSTIGGLYDLIQPDLYAEETADAEMTQAAGPDAGQAPGAAASPAPLGASAGGDQVSHGIVPVTEVSQFSGAAMVKIPIEVPPGRLGIAPNIALTYNSYRGNGWIGVGWDIDMGSIQRSTKRGLSYSARDYVAFINGSMADLVPRSDWGSNYYGAKVDSSLSGYYFNTSTKGWEVTSRDGTRYYYGSASSSRQDFDSGAGIFKWCLDKVVDVHGNFMTITYFKDQGEIYLTGIAYTGNTGLTPTHEVRFYTEDRPDAPLAFAPYRPVKTARRLKTIEVADNGRLVRAYRLSYATSAGTQRSLVSGVEQFGSDATLDATGAITGGTALPPLYLDWEEQKPHFFTDSAPFETRDAYSWDLPFWSYGDFNGDGKTDICYYPTPSDGSRKIKFSNGDGTFTDGPKFKVVDIYSWSPSFWAYGDFNGDGKTDICYYPTPSDGSRKIKFSNGDGTFTDGPRLKISDIYSWNPPYWSYGDFNGDGKTDICYYTNIGQWKIKSSNGDGTFTDGPAFSTPDAYSYSDSYWSYGDFNGDGKTDIIYHTTTAYEKRIKFSNGDGTFTDGPEFLMSDAYGWDSPTYVAYADFNGDGKTDIIYHTTTANQKRIKFSDGGKDLLVSFTSTLGGQTSIAYTPSSAHDNTLMPFILQTVSSITTEDGRGGAQTVKYFYEGGLFDYAEREFRGFRKVTAYAMHDHESFETRTETWFHQDATRKGTIEVQFTTGYDGHTRQVNNEVTAANLSGGATWPRLDGVTTTVTDAGAAPCTIVVEYDYDACLNITGEHKSGMTPEDEVHAYSTYTCPNSRWIIAKPMEAKVKNAAGAIVSAKWMDYDSAGNLTAEELCRSDTPATGCQYRNSQNPTVRYAYTPEGNVVSTTDPEWKKTTFAYDETRTLAVETVNPLGHRTTKEYDTGTGKVLKLIPPHLQGTGLSFSNAYDVFGRIIQETRPDGGSTAYQYLLGNPTSQYVGKTEYIAGGVNRYSYAFFDGMGKVYATQTMGDEGYVIVTDTFFDSLGRVAATSRPYRYGIDEPVYVTMTYDGLSRLVTTTYPDGTTTSTSYQGLTRKVQDQNWNVTTSTYDVYGRLRGVTDPYGTVTTYAYDTLGNLTGVTAAYGMREQNTTTMTYDSLSKKRSMHDPDMGTWTYSYDKRGNLASQTDAKGQTIIFTYDAINRLLERNYADHTVTNTYDDPAVPYSTGMPTATSDPSSGESVLVFDVMQRVTRSRKRIDAKSIDSAKTYDSAGRVATRRFHPDTTSEKSFAYQYDWAGNLLAIHDNTSGIDHVRYTDFTALGQPAIALFPKSDGSFVRTTYGYDPFTGRLARLLTEKTRQSTKTAACSVHTGEPIATATYTCDLTKKTFDTEQGCINVCRQTAGCSASAPAVLSGSASGAVTRISAGGNTMNFFSTTCDLYGNGNCSESAIGNTAFTSTPLYTCPYGSEYDCDASNMCRREGICAPGTQLTCAQGYTLTGNTCTGNTCPLGDYACSGTPSTCTGSGMDAESTLQDLAYQYDAKGNIRVLVDSVKGITHEYFYDSLNRLIHSQGTQDTGTASYEQSYAYDSIGNITYKSGVGAYTYNYQDKPHAVRQAGNISLEYDENGNMTLRSVSSGTRDLSGVWFRRLQWNQDNKPVLITGGGGGGIRYTYDGSGQRVRKENLTTGRQTLYFGDAYEERGSVGVIHLFANGQRVASLRTDGKIQYYHGNHLGSASLITDQNGALKETIEYMPFGTYRDRTDHDKAFPNVNYTFTDQEDDDETELYNFSARLYDPLLGRFISADSIVPEPGNLQAFNRYSYCVNNPLVYMDPSGYSWLSDFFDDIGLGFINDIWGSVAQIAAGSIGTFVCGPVCGALAAGAVNYAITGDAGSALASAVQAGFFYAAGEIAPGNPWGHAAAGAAGGSIGAAVTGQDIGRGALVGAMAGFSGTFFGRYIPGGFASQLIGRSLIGGVTGGFASAIYGDSFGEGFQQGAVTAAFAFTFNECLHGKCGKSNVNSRLDKVIKDFEAEYRVQHLSEKQAMGLVIQGIGFLYMAAAALGVAAFCIVNPAEWLHAIPHIGLIGSSGALIIEAGERVYDEGSRSGEAEKRK